MQVISLLPRLLLPPLLLLAHSLAHRFVLSCEADLPGSPQGSGGHYPALMTLAGSPSIPDRQPLVHWCHGAPGAVFLWCKAYEVRPAASGVYQLSRIQPKPATPLISIMLHSRHTLAMLLQVRLCCLYPIALAGFLQLLLLSQTACCCACCRLWILGVLTHASLRLWLLSRLPLLFAGFW
jgi:hypothetical protein